MQQVAHYLRPPADAWTPALRARVVRAHLFGRPRRPLRRFCGARGGLSERAVARRRPAPIEPRRPPPRGPGSGPDLRGISGATVVSLLFFHPSLPARLGPTASPAPLPLFVLWRLFGGAFGDPTGALGDPTGALVFFPTRPSPCLPARRFFLTRQGIDAPLHVRPLHARSGIGGSEEGPRPILRGGLPVRVL